MQGNTLRSTVRLGLLALIATGALLAPSSAEAAFNHNPILFVHGIEGSGAQFESQKMRFTSNGYPANWFDEVDYNSTRAVGDKSEVDQQIDQAVATLKQRTHRSKVDIVAHSLGTSVMFDYLTNGSMAAQRRANVGHYINVDGQNQNPGVPTLAVWAGIPLQGGGATMGPRHMDGARNVTIPNQTHVQTCTSAQSFVQYYDFLTGHRPANDLVPQSGPIRVAGKTLNFPQNNGLAPSVTQIWPVDANGRRTRSTPLHSLQITDGSEGGGHWGPVTVRAGQRYEFAIVRDGFATLHYYYEPFVRSDYTLRLNASDPITQYVGNRPGSVSGVNIRYKEIWGDRGAQSDVLRINGLSVCTAHLCPQSKDVNAFFAFDRNRDGKTDLSDPDPVVGNLPFLQGADVFMPGATPPNGTTSFSLRSRGRGPVRTLRTPNWDSKPAGDGPIIQWDDFELPGGFSASQLLHCGVPTKRVRGRTLDHARLGLKRSTIRRRYPQIEQRRRYVDRFCLVRPYRGGRAVRVGYPSPRLMRHLSRHTRRRIRGRAVLALTSSGYFRIRGIRHGTRVRTLRRRLHGERSFRIGRNRWFLARGRKARLVFKVRHGRVREVGIASLGLTRGRRARTFMRSFG